MLNMFRYLICLFLIADLYAQLPASTDRTYDKVTNSKSDLYYQRGTFKYPDSQEILDSLKLNNEIFQNKSVSERMATIKYNIVNGNLEKAKAKLLQAQYFSDYSTPIQKRYLALIYFIEGEYEKSLETLQDKMFYTFENNKHVCLLRVLNFLILNRNIEALNDWKTCRDETVNKTTSYHLWMNSLIELKANKTKIRDFKTITNLNIENESGEMLALFLKLALYLDKPEKVLNRLSLLSDEIYNIDKLRELIGLLYFRDNQIVNSYKFIEDLTSVNSENLKGNLFLAQKKYELAYAQFKLALLKKADSQNALERITPTAWILKQWEDGLKFTKKLKVSKADIYRKQIIQAAFEIQLKKYDEAKKSLNTIINSSKNALSPEVNIMNSLVNFLLKDKIKSIEYSNKSCNNLDGANCWLQYQLTSWDDFTRTAQRDSKVFESTDSLVEKYTKSYQSEKIKEDLLIDQKDIEEMDNSLISLMPK